MLDDLETVAWGELSHAYGSATDTPELLRDLASTDAAEAAEALAELIGSIFHQGSVYPATVAAVPFLVWLAGHAPHQRAELLWTIGRLADEEHAYDDDFPLVRAAVIAHAEELTALLTDADPEIREGAAYATVRADGSAEALRQRWAAEDDEAVRASLALALGEADPNAGPVLDDAARYGPPKVRAAAALALTRARREWPPGTVPALVTALDDGAGVNWFWHRDAEWTDELSTGPEAVELLQHMLRSGGPTTRVTALEAASARCDALRSAPPLFVPLAAPLLGDQDPDVRAAAVAFLHKAGAAAGQAADEIAAIAAELPDRAGATAFSIESRAVVVLQRLGDPRWVEPVHRTAARGHQVPVRHELTRFTPAVLTAVRDRPADRPGDARLPGLGLPTGADGSGDVPALRSILAGDTRVGEMPDLSGFGDTLAPLLPAALEYLTGRPERVPYQRDRQILAARVVSTISGPERVLPTVEAVLHAGDSPARHAADLIADLARTAPATVKHLIPALRDRLDDRWNRLSAARALARLGVPTAELAEALVQGLTDYAGRLAPPIIRELRAVETIPALEELLARDERFDVTCAADEIVWADELLQEDVRDTITHLRASTPE